MKETLYSFPTQAKRQDGFFQSTSYPMHSTLYLQLYFMDTCLIIFHMLKFSVINRMNLSVLIACNTRGKWLWFFYAYTLQGPFYHNDRDVNLFHQYMLNILNVRPTQ